MKINNSVETGSLCDLVSSRSPKDLPNAEFSYIDISGIDRDLKQISVTKRLLGCDAPSRARQIVHGGDILVSTVRPNLNAVAMVPDDLHNEIASTGFCVLRPRKDQLHNRYLFYFVQSSDFIRYLMSRMKGAGYPAVSDRIIKSALLPSPHLKEQARIVELLDQANALRKLRHQADEKAARILPALFHHYFGDPLSNNRQLEICPLAEVGEFTGGGTPSKKVIEYWDGNIPWVSPKDMKSLLISETKDYITDLAIQNGSTSLIPAESVLFVFRSGILRHSAPVALNSKPVAINQDMKSVQVSEEFNPYYMLAWAQVAESMLLSCVKGGATVQSIETSKFKALPVLKAPKIKQDQFSSQYKTLISTQTQTSTSRQKLEDLFQLLLHRAFTGELTAKWREDHMSELVEEMEIQSKG